MNNFPNRPPPAYMSEEALNSRDVEACLCSSQRNDIDQIQGQVRSQAQRQVQTPASRQSVSATPQITGTMNATTRHSFLRGVVDETESTYKKNERDACYKFKVYLALMFIGILLIFFPFWLKKLKK